MSFRRIGIDLDHTILKNQSGSGDAEILFGFKAFVMAQREADRRLFILCHMEGKDKSEADIKTELEGHGIFKPMAEGGFGFSADDLVCSNSNEDLIGKIKALKLTHYIGSSDIFEDDAFPASTQPVLLNDGSNQSPGFPCFQDWSELSNMFIWETGVTDFAGSRLSEFKTLKGHGENHVHSLLMEDGKRYVLKHFFEHADAGSQAVEAAHLKALIDAGIDNVPEPHWQEGAWTLSSWLDGKPPEDPDDNDVDQTIDFLVRLDQAKEKLKVGNAKRARLSFNDYVSAVNDIWKAVLAACQRPDGPKDILMFVMTDMEQMRQDNQNHMFLWCKRENWDRDKPFVQKDLMFNPGDFGLHNSMKDDSGRLHFLDFEDSGWDDPAHLMADFFHNTEQNLSIEAKLKVLDAFVKHRSWDTSFQKRFWAVADVVAVEWIFRTLLVVVPEEMRRQQFINPSVDPKQLIKDRFKQALAMKEAFKPMEHVCKPNELLTQSDLD